MSPSSASPTLEQRSTRSTTDVTHNAASTPAPSAISTWTTCARSIGTCSRTSTRSPANCARSTCTRPTTQARVSSRTNACRKGPAMSSDHPNSQRRPVTALIWPTITPEQNSAASRAGDRALVEMLRQERNVTTVGMRSGTRGCRRSSRIRRSNTTPSRRAPRPVPARVGRTPSRSCRCNVS